MINKIFLLVLFFSFGLQAQFSISGEFSPQGKVSWTMLYRIKNAQGVFVENSDVISGKFRFKTDETFIPGMYRILYQTDKQQSIDILINKEDISFHLNPEQPATSLHFTASEENKLYYNYLKIVGVQQGKLDSIQKLYFETNNSELEEAYKKQLKSLNYFQDKFEKDSKTRLAGHFIKAECLYNSDRPEKTFQSYLNSQRKHYFDFIDFDDPVLINSTVINDKLTDYIFKMHSGRTKEKSEILQKLAVDEVVHKLQDKPHILQPFEERIIRVYQLRNQPKMVRYIFDKYYLKLPEKYIDPVFKESVSGDLKTAVGSKSPDLKWNQHGKAGSLYKLKPSNYYIIVFFSTDCSHCLEQMPVFYKTFKNIKKVQVITIGLETDKAWWKNMTSGWKEFINILDLKNWESERVKDFGVTGTPTYFVLDKNKTIIAKPDTVEEVREFFGIK